MKKVLLAIGMVAAVVMGCSTTKQTQELLSAAGFKTVPANTPEQVAHLKTLPKNKITIARRDGVPYWTYPDVADNLLYVGQEAQYQQYEKLRLQKQIADEGVTAAEDNAQSAWGVWGGWGGWGWR
jgi:hypothetical protein